ncbi:helix-turn-helix transcriptional regulator [Tropicimonas sp. TH_r6]|uniref:helix-turn-helix transcriptional regulator n=1 Tax=Tropicimonas sp. TH_r6 TaxID=3082085 RepID=UPI003985CB32
MVTKRSSSQIFLAQVRRALARQVSLQDTSAEAVAGRFGWSVRKLQRRLKENGTSFREIRASVLEEHARRMLLEPDMSIDEVAQKLGYSEPNSFRRAFKSWTGASPSNLNS